MFQSAGAASLGLLDLIVVNCVDNYLFNRMILPIAKIKQFEEREQISSYRVTII